MDSQSAQAQDPGYVGVYVDDLLIAGPRSLNDSLISAVKGIWKTSAPEHLGPDPDCAELLFLALCKICNLIKKVIFRPKLKVQKRSLERCFHLVLPSRRHVPRNVHTEVLVRAGFPTHASMGPPMLVVASSDVQERDQVHIPVYLRHGR